LNSAKIKYTKEVTDTRYELLSYFDLLRLYKGLEYIEEKYFKYRRQLIKAIIDKKEILNQIQELSNQEDSEEIFEVDEVSVRALAGN
jgi:hypothetical protein